MEAILLYVSVMAFTYLGYLFWHSKRLYVSEVAYRLILLILTVEVMMIWLFKTEYIQQVPHLMRVNSPLIFLLAPSFYMLLRGKVLKNKTFRYRDLVHLLPSIILFGYLLPFYILSSQEKLALYHEWLQGIQIDSFPSSELYRLQQLVYVFLILIVFLPKTRKVDTFVLVMVVSYLAIWMIDLYRYFFVGSSYLMISTYLIAFIPVMIFFELNAKKKRSEKKYATSGIQSSRTESIALQAYDLIVDEELYKNSRLSLNDVAAKLDLHHNYISQAINSTYGKKFKDMVNSMRVKEAKKLLGDKSMNHLTLEAIAEMSGFNSISSFNSSFKKIQNETPSSFKKRVQQLK